MKTLSLRICAATFTAATFTAVCAHAANTPDETPFIYTASYETGSWLGHVSAYPIAKEGVSQVAQWDAADLIPAWQARRILTAADNAVVGQFEWQELSEWQKAALSSEDILQYLKGNGALEIAQGAGRFRNRKGKLGDIIHSSPLYVGLSDSAYHLMPAVEGGDSYQEFVNGKKRRRAMLYVGANDGMLHAFDAITGVEHAAFIPRAIFEHLHELSEAGYVHRPFVDGPLTASDAYLSLGGRSAWKTIMLGSTGAGAKSLFALDISDPEALASTSLTGNPLLWQRSAEDDGLGAVDDDMGYVPGEAFAIRLRNGRWAAIYGNGYQSKNRRAALYLTELASGGLIRKLYAGTSDAASSNGLTTPALVFSAQREVSAAYAGDLQGSLWKFDLSSSQPQQWQTAFDSQPLFVAADGNGKMQSIVQQPLLEQHAKGGAIVMFSGGKAEHDDGGVARNEPQTQTLYGVWEKTGAAAGIGRAQLQQQTLTESASGQWQLSRDAVDWNKQRGWYVDLPAKAGHVVGKLQIIDGVLWVLTYSPAAEKSYLIAIDYTIGGATADAASAVFPQNVSMIEVAASTVTPNAIKLPDGRRQLVIRGRDGLPYAIDLNPANRRPSRTWRQLPVPLTAIDPG